MQCWRFSTNAARCNAFQNGRWPPALCFTRPPWLRTGPSRPLPALLSAPETLSFLAWTLVASYALVLYRYGARPLGVVTMPLVSLLIFVAVITRSATPDRAEASSLAASWLFPVHTTLLLFAYGAFFVVFLASIMYLLQERELKLKTFSAIFHRLPSLTTVNEIATSSAAIGLTLLTVGICDRHGVGIVTRRTTVAQ